MKCIRIEDEGLVLVKDGEELRVREDMMTGDEMLLLSCYLESVLSDLRVLVGYGHSPYDVDMKRVSAFISDFVEIEL